MRSSTPTATSGLRPSPSAPSAASARGTYQRNECIGATIGCLPDPFEAGDDIIFQNIVIGYLNAWIEDIDDGLEEWSKLGLASTRALFDPQALRDTQNDECDHLGSEGSLPRANCEDGIGATDVLLHELDPFINNHLLSMLGAPDVVGDARAILQTFSSILDDIIGPALNPLRLVTAEIKELAKEIIIEEINNAFGVDIEVLASFLKHPSYWLDVEQVSLDLGPLGTQQVDLFGPEDHERLDASWGCRPTTTRIGSSSSRAAAPRRRRSCRTPLSSVTWPSMTTPSPPRRWCSSTPRSSTGSAATSWPRQGW